jgi:hypothetical protein
VVSFLAASRRTVVAFLMLASWLTHGSAAYARGPYTEAGIPSASPLFLGWATGVQTFVRGPQTAGTTTPLASFGVQGNALGPVDGQLVSLGDGGSITLTFAAPITNGPGPDFAVFENGFLSGGRIFAELAHVEVSSDGVHFFEFPSVSLTQTTMQVAGTGTVDATDIYDLAGKHVAGTGTPFDLSEIPLSLSFDPLAVTQVRLTDVVGSITPGLGSTDSQGHIINDPFPTPFASGGFDLEAVGVMHFAAVPEPSSFLLVSAGAIGVAAWRRRRAGSRSAT